MRANTRHPRLASALQLSVAAVHARSALASRRRLALAFNGSRKDESGIAASLKKHPFYSAQRCSISSKRALPD